MFCFNEFIINKKKRKFFQLASKILDSKISLEYLIYQYSSFEKMKLFLFNQEEQEYLDLIPNIELEKHINQMIAIKNHLS